MPRSRRRSRLSSHRLGYDVDGPHRLCSGVTPQPGLLDKPCGQGSQLANPFGARSGRMAKLVEQHRRNVGDSGPGPLAFGPHSRPRTRLPDVAGLLRRHLHHPDACRRAAPLDVGRRGRAGDPRSGRDMDRGRYKCLANQPASDLRE